MARPADVRAGDLNVPLMIRLRSFGRDGSGGPVVSSQADGTSIEWGSVRPATGREFERFGLTIAEMTHTIAIRKHADTDLLGNGDALIHGARVFEIVSKQNVDERGNYYLIAAKEVVSG